MTTFILATRNAHKVQEIRSLLSARFRYRTLADFPQAPQIIEDADTFAGNATKKALRLAQWLGSSVASKDQELTPGTGETLVLADDSGLEVDALNGAPGVHSARFAALDSGHAGNSSDTENNSKLLRLLRNVPAEKRTARFRCVVALVPVVGLVEKTASPVCMADEAELRAELFEGVCEGRIGFAAAGSAGFGYDPLFVPNGCELTFAELGEDVKNEISHRANALRKLRQKFPNT